MAADPNLFRVALNAFADEVRNAITRVSILQPETNDFLDEFAADFSARLSGDDGPVIWRADRTNLLALGRYLGTLAEFYAAAGGTLEPVGEVHLRMALEVIKPKCKLGELPEEVRARHPETGRRQYCENVATLAEREITATRRKVAAAAAAAAAAANENKHETTAAKS
jgi:hypothetical protein